MSGSREKEMKGQRRTACRAGCVGLIFLCAAVVLGASTPRQSFAQMKSGMEGQKISTEVALVPLSVVVTDKHGKLVRGLKAENFQVLENGVPQTISTFNEEDRPLTIGLVVDSSGSMRNKRAEVLAAALGFVESSNREDQVFVVNFNEKVSFGLPSGVAFTNNVQELEEAIAKSPATGETALYDAIVVAMKHLKLGSKEKKALLIVSDGGDNASAARLKQVVDLALQNSASIYAIGIFDEGQHDADPKVLKELAKETGGRAYFPSSLDEIPGICQQIARWLREQYTLAYSPLNREHDGTFRTIRVLAQAPGQGKLMARVRKGYYAASADHAAAAMAH